MVSIKVDVNNIEDIVSCLNIIILKYTEKNGNLNNAVIFVPSVAYKLMAEKCSKADKEEGVGLKSLYGWVRLIEDMNIKDMLFILDKSFFNLGTK